MNVKVMGLIRLYVLQYILYESNFSPGALAALVVVVDT